MNSMYIKNPMTQDSAASTSESTTAPKKAGKRIQVRKSGVHGKGVFSTVKLKKQFECRCGTKGCRGTMLAPKKR